MDAAESAAVLDLVARLEARVERLENLKGVNPVDALLTLEEAYAEGVVKQRPDLLRRWWREPAKRAAEALEALLLREGCHLYTTRARADNWHRLRADSVTPTSEELSVLLDEEVVDEVAAERSHRTERTRTRGAARGFASHVQDDMGAGRRRPALNRRTA